MSSTSQLSTDRLRAYHARTKHRFEAFAEGPGQIDWDTQPAAFRHYVGAPVLQLPLAGERFERPFGQLEISPKIEIAPDLTSLGTLLELSFGLSAWKSWGPSRWALRCNPSSGNLHPVEAYVLAAGLAGVPDGLHHYDPEQHALEGRALPPPIDQRWLVVGLSNAMWREAWKYGERAFRYCQLDVGHAVGALAYAAALLGWRVEPLKIAGGELAHVLGLDRGDDFPSGRSAFTEAEEAEILLVIHAPGLSQVPPDLVGWLDAATWHGQPSCIDPAPVYRWPIIAHAAEASRPNPEIDARSLFVQARNFPAGLPALPPHPTLTGAAELIRQRRSGQRFDPKFTLDKAAFYRMLDATLPRIQAPFTGQEAAPAIALLLFVLRVDGLPPGLYLLPRTPTATAELPALLGAADDRFAGRCAVAEVDPDCPVHLNLTLLAALEMQALQRLARSLACHQDIASTSAFSLGMLADFDRLDVAYAYRTLLREAGLIGQALYLEAEAAGVRGTGIGCFFDDPVHQSFGLAGERWQSVYHFTIGTPNVDNRIETGPPYPQRQTQSP